MTKASRYIWLAFAAALLLRAAWVLISWLRDGPALSFDDERLHWQLATNLVDAGNFVTDDGRLAARMPLYPLYLALFAPWGDSGILAARLGQALLGAAGVAVACWWAGRFTSPRGALLAATLICVDPFSVFFCNLLLTEALFAPIALTLSALCWQLAARRETRSLSPRFICGAALLSTAAVMCRPEALFWVIPLWAATVLISRRRASAAWSLAPAALLMLAALVAWGLRNQAVLGTAVWLSTNGGVTLYDGHRPGADGGSDQSFLAKIPELRAMNEVERDAYLTHAASERIRNDPAEALRLAGVKFMRTWNPVPNNADYRGGMTAWASAVYTLLVLALGIVGTLRLRDWRAALIAWLPVIVFTALSCLFVGSVRYRVPLMPFVCIAAAGAWPAREETTPAPPGAPSRR